MSLTGTHIYFSSAGAPALRTKKQQRGEDDSLAASQWGQQQGSRQLKTFSYCSHLDQNHGWSWGGGGQWLSKRVST